MARRRVITRRRLTYADVIRKIRKNYGGNKARLVGALPLAEVEGAAEVTLNGNTMPANVVHKSHAEIVVVQVKRFPDLCKTLKVEHLEIIQNLFETCATMYVVGKEEAPPRNPVHTAVCCLLDNLAEQLEEKRRVAAEVEAQAAHQRTEYDRVAPPKEPSCIAFGHRLGRLSYSCGKGECVTAAAREMTRVLTVYVSDGNMRSYPTSALAEFIVRRGKRHIRGLTLAGVDALMIGLCVVEGITDPTTVVATLGGCGVRVEPRKLGLAPTTDKARCWPPRERWWSGPGCRCWTRLWRFRFSAAASRSASVWNAIV